ncbi:aspA [Symbiodinium microadriaticum]|nr:aspA [Symbiodinium microadriaticum]
MILADDLIEASSSVGDMIFFSGMLRRIAAKVSKICNDLRLLSSGPRCGLAEINLPPKAPGSSIMPGKVNPVIPEVMNMCAFEAMGNDVTVAIGAEAGQLELNVMEPVIIYKLFSTLRVLARGINTLRSHCIEGITANKEHCKDMVYNSVGVVTALLPHIGYKKCTEAAAMAVKDKRPVADIIVELGFLKRDEAFSSLEPAREAAAELLFKLVRSAMACGEDEDWGGVQWALDTGAPDLPAFAQVLKFTLGERTSKPEVVCSIPNEDDEAEEEEKPKECDPECHEQVSAEGVASVSRWSTKRPREDSEWTFLVVSRAIAPVYDMAVRACRAVCVSAEEASSLAEEMLFDIVDDSFHGGAEACARVRWRRDEVSGYKSDTYEKLWHSCDAGRLAAGPFAKVEVWKLPIDASESDIILSCLEADGYIACTTLSGEPVAKVEVPSGCDDWRKWIATAPREVKSATSSFNGKLKLIDQDGHILAKLPNPRHPTLTFQLPPRR